MTPSEYMAIDHFGLTPPGRAGRRSRSGDIAAGRPHPDQPERRADRGRASRRRDRACGCWSTPRRRSSRTCRAMPRSRAPRRVQTLNIGGSTATTVSFVVERGTTGAPESHSRLGLNSHAPRIGRSHESPDRRARLRAAGRRRPPLPHGRLATADVGSTTPGTSTSSRARSRRDLNGVYLRNTENGTAARRSERYHPFDGDGMLHSISFGGGRSASITTASCAPTDFCAEQRGGPSTLWAGHRREHRVGRDRRGRAGGRSPNMKDASSTDVDGAPRRRARRASGCVATSTRFDPASRSKTAGKEKLGGRCFPAEGISAHPEDRRDTPERCSSSTTARRGALHALRRASIADGRAQAHVHRRAPARCLAFLTTWRSPSTTTIFNDLPMFWDPEAHRAAGHYVDPSSSPRSCRARFGIVPRHGGSEEVRWFEADPTYVLHWIERLRGRRRGRARRLSSSHNPDAEAATEQA